MAALFCGASLGEVEWNRDNAFYKQTSSMEGGLDAFLGEPEFALQELFREGRFPNVVVAADGTVLSVFGGVSVRRSEDGGDTWGAPIRIASGFPGGGVTADEVSGSLFAFVEKEHPPSPFSLFASTDQGATWGKRDCVVYPNSLGHVPSMHMNEHGICLRHGKYKGRLIRPTRWYGRRNYPKEFFHTHYTNAIFSDDGGRSWKASEPVPLMGAGEACIVELSNGTLLYNTRRHWAEDKDDAMWRWSSVSKDGGATWGKATRSKLLPDGNQDSSYGLMGGMVRLPILGRDLLLFSNIQSAKGRRNGHVWVSFDGGKSWPLTRQVFDGAFAYSSMDAGKPGTPSEGMIFLLFEGGPPGAGSMARFNLSWLLAGEKTGDGEVPGWVSSQP